MNKKHDIKRFKVIDFVAFTFVGATYIPLHRLYQIVNTSSAILDQVGTSCNRLFGVRVQVIRTAWFLLMKKQLVHNGAAKVR